jgi:hypothetical protein
LLILLPKSLANGVNIVLDWGIGVVFVAYFLGIGLITPLMLWMLGVFVAFGVLMFI